MNELKKKLFVNAVNIRLRNGELLEDIMASYPNLTPEEKEIIIQEIQKK